MSYLISFVIRLCVTILHKVMLCYTIWYYIEHMLSYILWYKHLILCFFSYDTYTIYIYKYTILQQTMYHTIIHYFKISHLVILNYTLHIIFSSFRFLMGSPGICFLSFSNTGASDRGKRSWGMTRCKYDL